MLDKNELNNCWIEAAKAYREFQEWAGSESEDAGWECNKISLRWSEVWNLFERIGMSVKEVNGV